MEFGYWPILAVSLGFATASPATDLSFGSSPRVLLERGARVVASDRPPEPPKTLVESSSLDMPKLPDTGSLKPQDTGPVDQQRTDRVVGLDEAASSSAISAFHKLLKTRPDIVDHLRLSGMLAPGQSPADFDPKAV